MGDPPTIGGSHEPVVVDATDQIGVAAFHTGFDMLALELATACGRVAVYGDLVIADEVLGGVEPHNSWGDAVDDGLDTVTFNAPQHGGGIRSENISQLIELLGVERPGVRNGHIDDLLLVHASSVSRLRCGL